MPDLNELWDKYGCTECEDYNCLVAVVNFSDSKSAFQGWIDQHDMTCIGIPKEDGGQEFVGSDAFDYSAGGPTYLIKPDKTWERTTNYVSESDLTSAGVEPHTCNTGVITHKVAGKLNAIAVSHLAQNKLTLTVATADDYRINIYLSNGKVILSKVESLLPGLQTVSFNTLSLSTGLYLVEVKSRRQSIKTKIAINK